MAEGQPHSPRNVDGIEHEFPFDFEFCSICAEECLACSNCVYAISRTGDVYGVEDYVGTNAGVHCSSPLFERRLFILSADDSVSSFLEYYAMSTTTCDFHRSISSCRSNTLFRRAQLPQDIECVSGPEHAASETFLRVYILQT